MAAIEFNNQKMDAIIREARACGASDIHISEGMQTRYRVHGRLVQAQTQYSADETAELLQSMMNEKQKKHFANGNDADFAIRTSDGCRQRVNVFRQQKKIAATIRLLNSTIPTLEELKMPTILYKMAMEPRGLILVTGPTGSGKSTTLAAMIEHMNQNSDRHIITIEDPIEYVYESKQSLIHQREVGEDITDFASAIRSALREDPDVILVGEMRDYETISTALLAAETGHLVLSTLHTTGATQTIERIVDACPTGGQNQVQFLCLETFTDTGQNVCTKSQCPARRNIKRNRQPVPDPMRRWNSPRGSDRTSCRYGCHPQPRPRRKGTPDPGNDADWKQQRYAYPEYGSVQTRAAGIYHKRRCDRLYQQ